MPLKNHGSHLFSTPRFTYHTLPRLRARLSARSSTDRPEGHGSAAAVTGTTRLVLTGLRLSGIFPRLSSNTPQINSPLCFKICLHPLFLPPSSFSFPLPLRFTGDHQHLRLHLPLLHLHILLLLLITSFSLPSSLSSTNLSSRRRAPPTGFTTQPLPPPSRHDWGLSPASSQGTPPHVS